LERNKRAYTPNEAGNSQAVDIAQINSMV